MTDRIDATDTHEIILNAFDVHPGMMIMSPRGFGISVATVDRDENTETILISGTDEDGRPVRALLTYNDAVAWQTGQAAE